VPGKQRLAFMIYFRGKAGWHEGRWRSRFEPNRDTLYSTSVFDLGAGWFDSALGTNFGGLATDRGREKSFPF
jgi:hypothetical protein